MSYTLPPITLTQNQVSYVNIPGNLGAVSWVKLVNASPYLCNVNNLLGGSDYLQPGEANVWHVPGLTTSIQVLPSLYGISPSIIPASVLVVTWYLDGEQPQGNYPVNFNALNFLGNTVSTNASTPNSLEQDLLTPFVLSGLTATQDGSTANRLDVASGVALVRQSDASLGRVAPNATFFLTTQVSSTYYLFLNPDGSYTWQLSSTVPTNSLAIAQATTDASGNIATVTDVRITTPTLLSSSVSGNVALPTVDMGATGSGLQFGPALGTGSYVQAWLRFITSPFDGIDLITPLGGALTTAIRFITATGGATKTPLSIGDATSTFTSSRIAGDGHIAQLASQATAGSFGVPVIVAQALDTHVSVTTQVTVLTLTVPATGLYRASVYFYLNNGTSGQTITLQYLYTDANQGTPSGVFLTGVAGAVTIFGNSNTVANGLVYCFPAPVYALGGATMSIIYQDRGGTPNDFVTALIERLS